MYPSSLFFALVLLLSFGSPAHAQVLPVAPLENWTVKTVAGGGFAVGNGDGTGSAARFFRPGGIVCDSSGNVLVADSGNHRIRRVSVSGQVVTLAGSGQGARDGTGTLAQFDNPVAVALDGAGNLLIGENLTSDVNGTLTNTGRIRKMTPAGVVSTLVANVPDGISDLAAYGAGGTRLGVLNAAGTGVRSVAVTGGTFSAVTPSAVSQWSAIRYRIASGPSDRLYIVSADRVSYAVVGSAALVDVTPLNFFLGNIGTGACRDVAVDAKGNLLALCTGNHHFEDTYVDMVSATGRVTRLAGAPGDGTVPSDGVGVAAVLIGGSGLALSPQGFLYVLEGGASWGKPLAQLRIVLPFNVSVTPASQEVSTAAVPQLLRMSGSGAGLGFRWFKSGTVVGGAVGGSLALSAGTASAGLYTVEVSVGSGLERRVVFTEPAEVRVGGILAAGPAVILSQPVLTNAPVVAGQKLEITVKGDGLGPVTYQWYKDGILLAGATQATFLVSSARDTDAGEYTVEVGNALAKVRSVALAVGVSSAPRVVTQPVGVAAPVGQSVTLSAVVAGSSPMQFEWRKDGVLVGSLSGAEVAKDFVMVAPCTEHVLGIKSDGSLWSWGTNKFGQLGTGNTEDKMFPVQVGLEKDWASAYAFSVGDDGSSVSYAIKKDGSLWAWGYGEDGCLGDVGEANRLIPVRLGTDAGWAKVSRNDSRVIALKTDGSVVVWGKDLVIGNNRASSVDGGRATLGNLSGAKDVLYGSSGGYVIRGDGSLWSVDTLAQLGSERDFTALAAGSNSILAMKSDGSVWSQGYYLQSFASSPAYPPALFRLDKIGAGWTAIACGGWHNFARKPDGTVWEWHEDDQVLNMTGNNPGRGALTQVLSDGVGFTQIAASGAGAGYALSAEGTPYAWCLRKQMRVGTRQDWVSVAASQVHFGAINKAGELYLWGANHLGQLGTGGTLAVTAPKQVGAGFVWRSVVVSDWGNTYAIRSDGSLWACGQGPLGDGTASSRTVLTRIGPDTDWASIAIGSSESNSGVAAVYGVKKDGSLWTWGGSQLAPMAYGGSGNWKQVSADSWGAAGTKNDGSLWSIKAAGATQIGSSKEWNAVYYNYLDPVAVKSDGSLWGWGGYTGSMEPLLLDNSSLWSGFARSPGWNVLVQKRDGSIWDIGNSMGGWGGAPKLSGTLVADAAFAQFDVGPLAVKKDGTLWSWVNYFPTPVAATPSAVASGGSTTASFSLGSLQVSQTGVYNLKATNAFGAVTSSTVPVLAWTLLPAGTHTLNGGSVTLSGAVSAGTLAPTYQWYRNGVKINGATKPAMGVAGAVGGGVYQLEAAALGSAFKSPPAFVYVDSALLSLFYEQARVKDYTAARATLSKVLLAEPTNLSAKMLSGLLDLFLLAKDPATVAMLQKLGFSGVSDPWSFDLQWNGFPAGALSADAKGWLRSSLYPRLQTVDTSLAAITDPFFATKISTALFSDPFPEWVLVDYGDVKLLRAGLNAGMALIKWLDTLNTDADLGLLQSERAAGRVSIESFLGKFPSVLAASTIAPAAQLEFASRLNSALSLYQEFSNFVNPDPAYKGAVRLFPGQTLATLTEAADLAQERVFRAVVDKAALSLKATTVAAGVQTFYSASGKPVVVNPLAFVAHGPGWRDAVPGFSRNLLKQGSLKAALATAVVPNLKPALFPEWERKIAGAEPALSDWLLTRDDQAAPTVVLPADFLVGNKLLLSPDSEPPFLLGQVTDASEVARVVFEWKSGTQSGVEEAFLEEQPSATVLGGLRSWNWRIDLPFAVAGQYSYSLYALDRYSQKSTPKTGFLTVTQGVRVWVNLPDPAYGTLLVTPAIPASGLLETGTKLRVSATPKAGYLFRVMEVVVGGVPLDDITPSRAAVAEFTLTGDTEITPQFILNPYPALAGQWSGVFSEANGTVLPSSNSTAAMGTARKPASSPGTGAVTLSVTKTGTYTLRVIWGRSAFSTAGVFDSAGFARISVPAVFGQPVKFSGGGDSVAIGTGGSGWGALAYATLSVDEGIRFECGNNGQGGAFCFQSVALDKALDPAAIKEITGALPRRYNATTGDGFVGVDVTAAGNVVVSGASANGSRGSVRLRISYSASTAFTKNGLAGWSDSWGTNFYSVASPAGRIVRGLLDLTPEGCSGRVASSQANTGALDPLQQFATDDFSAIGVDGRVYISPSPLLAPAPFWAGNTADVYLAGSFKMGGLSWLGRGFVFRPTVAGYAGAVFAVRGASVSINPATGVFSGTVLSTGSIQGGTASAQQSRSFGGVLIQRFGGSGVGVTADGLGISVQSRLPGGSL